MLRERELAGEAREQIPAHRQDHVIGADGQDVQNEFVGDQRHGGKRQAGRDRGDRDAAPVDESAPLSWSAQQTFLNQCPHACVVEVPPRPFGFHAAEIEKIEIIGERKRLLDVLLDQQDRDRRSPSWWR